MIEIMKRILGFRSMLLMIIALSLLAYNIDLARAEQSIYKPTFSPELIYAGVPTKVRIAIRTGYDTKLIPSSVNLIQIKPNGSKIVISRMYDDATNGDLAANDGIYTVVLDFNEANSSTLTFQVSAAVQGAVASSPFGSLHLGSKAFPDLEVIWRQYVACLVKKDLEQALVLHDGFCKEALQESVHRCGHGYCRKRFRILS